MSHGHGHDSVACETSSKYTGYIESHLDKLKSKCQSLTACIDLLLLDENPLVVLKGEDISLNKTCGIVSRTSNQEYRTLNEKCTQQTRLEIHDDIEHHLKIAVTDGGWGKFNRCLENAYGDKDEYPLVDKVCMLAAKEKELCRPSVHRQAESFFNEQIQHLKCTCESLQHGHEHSFPVAAVAGMTVGGILALILIAVTCFCVYKRRKSKKKKKSPNVIYLPAPNAEQHHVYQDMIYQEVFDDRPYQSNAFCMSPSSNPPTLPTRYTSEPKAKEEEPAYLEPIELGSQKRSYRPALPKRGQPTSNPNYDAPPEYTEREEKPEDGAYFQPLPTPPGTPTEKEDSGYDKLLRPQELRTPPEGYETVEEARSSVPLEEAPRLVIPVEDVPLGPVPASRTKKSERQTESHYFVLEEKRQSEV
ncbi:hypothetical protein EGW08_015689 [Elysia chlorotica]|uniref:Uncharacterized protein n=1 Tax=Elysia chlorotica TaxID=188477 RepID=A0A433T4S4_ELYCH|nr:hypothetical protein EGW08_015689 [Elysia chlorotica]